MDEPVTLGAQQARAQIRDRIDAAVERGEVTIITRHGREVAALVPHQWYLEHTEKDSAHA